MEHGDAREGKWSGNWRMEWVASTLHTTSEHGASSITNADAHTSAASSRLNWRPRQFKWTRPFRRKTKSGFCGCAITFQTQSTTLLLEWGASSFGTDCSDTAGSLNMTARLWRDATACELPRPWEFCRRGSVTIGKATAARQVKDGSKTRKHCTKRVQYVATLHAKQGVNKETT